MKLRLLPFCLITGFLLAAQPGSAQSPDNSATLVIVDSRDPNLWDYGFKIFDENGKQVAAIKRCQIVRLSMTPGPHKFRCKDKKKVVSINAVAGETYYAQAGIRNMTMPALAQFDFNLINREEAESWVSKCKLPASSLDAESTVPEQKH